MKKEVVIGLDLGTTTIKAQVFGIDGFFVCEVLEKTRTFSPQENFKEQDPLEIEELAKIVLKKAIQEIKEQGAKLIAIGISSAMHSLICADKNFKPLSPMLIWSDGRSIRQVKELKEESGIKIYHATGTPLHPMSPLAKLMWMKKMRYEPYLKAGFYMTFKDFLVARWFGERVIDYAMAASTGLLNLETLEWDKDALNLAGIEEKSLSVPSLPTKLLFNMDRDVKGALGLGADIPVALGSADGHLANIGSGSILPGEINISLGTSGAIRQFVQGFPVNKKMETFTYPFDTQTAIVGGATNNGGIVLSWLKDLWDFPDYDMLFKRASLVSPGAEGLLFHPYLSGERAPNWDMAAKANFFGFSLEHQKEHFVKAALEGIAFNIYKIGQSLETFLGAPSKITVSGGLTRQGLMVQILADVFGKKAHTHKNPNSAPWGAAFTALVAIKKEESFEGIKKYQPKETVVEPDRENHARYREIYRRYDALGEMLRRWF